MADTDLPPTSLATAYTVHLSGEIDVDRQFDLHHIIESYRLTSAVHVVVDVGQVTFMDSTGLGFLAGLHREARERGGTVTVSSSNDQVERLIRLTGMDQFLVVEPG